MSMRMLIVTAAALGALSAPALAADLAEYPVAPAYSCASSGGLQPDDIYLAPKPAYIVASTCGADSNWLTLLGRPEILVYYGGTYVARPPVTVLKRGD